MKQFPFGTNKVVPGVTTIGAVYIYLAAGGSCSCGTSGGFEEPHDRTCRFFSRLMMKLSSRCCIIA